MILLALLEVKDRALLLVLLVSGEGSLQAVVLMVKQLILYMEIVY
jgi:hypothetical protein